MSESFDAYHKWLAIPPSEQPPNHYRLLGLGLFESDPDVISAAADRQMSHVQTYKNGPRAELSQKLLNEIATAKLCLLKPQKKGPYDEQLRQKLGAPQPGPSFGFPPGSPAATGRSTSMAGQASVPLSPLPPPPIAAPPPFDRFDDEATRSPWGATTIAAGVVLILLLIIAIWIVLKSGRGGDASTRTQQGTATTSSDSTPANATTSTTNDATPAKEPSLTPTVANDSEKSARPTNLTPNKTDVADVRTPNSALDVKPADASPSPPVKPSPVGLVKPAVDPAAAKSQTGADRRAPIPDASAQAAAEARFAAAFADTVPQSVLEKTKTLTDGPLVFVALNHALQGAIATGDMPLLTQILDELVRRFSVDAIALRAKTFVDVRQHIATTPAWEMLSQAALGRIDEATAAGHADLALPLAETSLLAARKANNMELIRKATLKALLHQAQGSGKGTENER